MTDLTTVSSGDNLVKVGLINLNYRKWENGNSINPTNPPFLLIHGLASALRIWDMVVAELMEQTTSTVVALDQRGHGKSDKPDNGYTTAQVVADDFSLVSQLGLSKPVVVGHSWGASIALAFAATHAEAVSAVILVDGGMGSMKERMTWEEAEQNLAPPNFAGTPQAAFLGFYRQNRQNVAFEQAWDTHFEDMVLNIVQLREDNTVAPRLSRANHMQILRSLWESDSVELAKAVSCPVLMISAESGATDPRSIEWAVIKREGAAKMQGALANSPLVEFVAMPDTIHDIPLQRPKALADLMVQFCKKAGVLK